MSLRPSATSAGRPTQIRATKGGSLIPLQLPGYLRTDHTRGALALAPSSATETLRSLVAAAGGPTASTSQLGRVSATGQPILAHGPVRDSAALHRAYCSRPPYLATPGGSPTGERPLTRWRRHRQAMLYSGRSPAPQATVADVPPAAHGPGPRDRLQREPPHARLWAYRTSRMSV